MVSSVLPISLIFLSWPGRLFHTINPLCDRCNMAEIGGVGGGILLGTPPLCLFYLHGTRVKRGRPAEHPGINTQEACLLGLRDHPRNSRANNV